MGMGQGAGAGPSEKRGQKKRKGAGKKKVDGSTKTGPDSLSEGKGTHIFKKRGGVSSGKAFALRRERRTSLWRRETMSFRLAGGEKRKPSLLGGPRKKGLVNLQKKG